MSCWNMINDKEIGARDVMPHKGLPYCDDNWDYSSYDFLLDYSALENCVKDIEEYLIKRGKIPGALLPLDFILLRMCRFGLDGPIAEPKYSRTRANNLTDKVTG